MKRLVAWRLFKKKPNIDDKILQILNNTDDIEKFISQQTMSCLNACMQMDYDIWENRQNKNDFAKVIKNYQSIKTIINNELEDGINNFVKNGDLLEQLTHGFYKYICGISKSSDIDKISDSVKDKVKNIIIKYMNSSIKTHKTTVSKYTDKFYMHLKSILKRRFPKGLDKQANDLNLLNIGETIELSLPLWQTTQYREGCFVIINNYYDCGKDTHSDLIQKMLKEHKDLTRYNTQETYNRQYSFSNKNNNGNIKECYGYVLKQHNKYFAVVEGNTVENINIREIVFILQNNTFNGNKYDGIFVVDVGNKNKTIRVAKKIYKKNSFNSL